MTRCPARATGTSVGVSTNAKGPDHLDEKKKHHDELPVHAHADAGSRLSREDVAALRHGTVFIVVRNWTLWQAMTEEANPTTPPPPPQPPSRPSSHNACVFLHITVRRSHYRYLYTGIHYVRKKTPTSTHAINTPESCTPHASFGMAVGSMQT